MVDVSLMLINESVYFFETASLFFFFFFVLCFFGELCNSNVLIFCLPGFFPPNVVKILVIFLYQNGLKYFFSKLKNIFFHP